MRIAIIGAGKMGSALIKSLKKEHTIKISDIDEAKHKKHSGVIASSRNIDSVKGSDVIILAVKPQSIISVLNEIKEIIKNKQLIISIAAGISIKTIEKILGKVPVIRAMPNTPFMIGEGMTGLFSGRYADSRHRKIADKIFKKMGKAIWVKKENDINAVTALSGSGPAYVYYFIESMMKAGREVGLNEDIINTLVKQTFKGAIALLEETGLHPKDLRIQVTSPKGTTEKAIKVFEEKKIEKIIEKAILAAYERAIELSRLY